MNPEADATAIIAAINAQFTTVRAFDMSDDDVKSIDVDHILVTVSRRYVDEQLASGEVPIPGGRVVTRYVAKTIANVYTLRSRTAAAIEDQILTGDVGPFSFESDEVPGPDDGWISAADVWTY